MTTSNVNANRIESLLNKEISLFKAATISFIVILVTWIILFTIGKTFFWKPTMAQTPQERGLNYYQALVDSDPSKPENWVDLGWYYYQSGEFDKALENQQKALELNPKHFGALYNSGLTYLQLSKPENAAEVLEVAVAENPNSWEANLALGVAFTTLKKWEEAEYALAQSLELNRHSADIHFYLGYLSEQQGEMDDASASYQEALRYDPNYQSATDGLGRIAETK